MKYCACETPGHSHLCGTVTGCPEECTWTPWDRIQKFQQGSCLKGHRKISRQTCELFLGPDHIPLYPSSSLTPSSCSTHSTHTHIHWPPALFHFLGHKADSNGIERQMVVVSRSILVIVSKIWKRSQLTYMKPCDHPCYMLHLQHFKENMRQKIQASIFL